MLNPDGPDCGSTDFSIGLPEGRIAARRIDPPGGAAPGSPVMVFLHEALGCIAMWKEVPERLVAMTGLPALVYDRHGHGLSDPMPRPREPDYLDRESFDVLPRVLVECGVTDPILVGHSDGGSIALLYASRHPVRALVSEAAHLFVEDVTLAGIRQAAIVWHETDLPQRLAKYHGDKTEALFSAWADCWQSKPFTSWNMEATLPGVSCPALVIQGEGDEYGTKAQVDAIATGITGPASVMMIPDCNHIPHFQAADTVLPAIAEFVIAQS
ncbi:MAG: alpha/beta hydrolase [Proteobacteria bacterium]|nr:alpha/beta hydrolase [Pseudomonadota bacterium]